MISVVIPVLNEPRVVEAVGSIDRQVTDHEIEIIVVDDGSTDGCLEPLHDHPRVRILRRDQPSGPAAARNAGLREVRGELVSFLDADDLWPAGRLARLEAALETRPELLVVLGRIHYVAIDGGELPDVQFEDESNTVSHVMVGCGLYRRAAFDDVGLFDEDLLQGEDADWFLRAREAELPFGIVHATTLEYRLHDNNMTADRRAVMLGVTTALRASIRRRRESGAPSRQLAPWDSHRLPVADVTVVIPARDRADLLPEAIASVHRQTVQPREVLVVDDGSTDATADVARDLGARVLRLEEGGSPGAARNAGFSAVGTSWILNLDSDDLLLPDAIERQMAHAEVTGAVVVLGGAAEFDHDRGPDTATTSREGLAASGMLLRADAFSSVGRLDELLAGDWIDWVDRAEHAGHRVHRDVRPVALRRLHGGNLGRAGTKQSYVHLARAALLRRRAGA